MTAINNQRLGIAGRTAAAFQAARITPLLALMGLLLGVFAAAITPREEEPQIDVTMASIMVAFPGASVDDVEHVVATPAEQILSGIAGVEHVMSVSQPELAVMTVQFEVGVPRSEALIRLHDTVSSHADWLAPDLGVQQPVIKSRGIDDVPIFSLTLFAQDPSSDAYDLERVAHSIETELKRVPGTREVWTIGGPGRVVRVAVDPARLHSHGLTLADVQAILQSANTGGPAGTLMQANQAILVETGAFLQSAEDVAALIIGHHNGRPVLLADLADVALTTPPARHYVWHARARSPQHETWPAITVAVSKKPGKNAIDVANHLMQRVDQLRGTVIPDAIAIETTRNYGETANEKARQLIQKLVFATLSVVALVYLALGRREAAIVGIAVLLTLTVTLFASWAWGFTLNRVSLFALIFSIGILVDDAIVVVENIHRHQQLHPGRAMLALIPPAVDEVGGPTILATFTVIAALLPMAFVTGLMGPYMSPIPINASMGMLLSLIIAFTITPWLARLWMKPSRSPVPPIGDGINGAITAMPDTEASAPIPEPADTARGALPDSTTNAATSRAWVQRLFESIFRPLLDNRRGKRNRRLLGLLVLSMMVVSIALPVTGLVQLKMLPFDNKSELQVIVDMPQGTPVEETAAVLHELGAWLVTIPEVSDYQAYAGTAAPINFNGLVRQYNLRQAAEMGDLQVNLVPKARRKAQSHAIATRIRPALQAIGQRHGANVKVVEVPPGPPVQSPIVAEIHGPDPEGRRALARAVRQVFETTPGVVDVDDSLASDAQRLLITVDRPRAAALGVAQADIVHTLQAALGGTAASWLRDGSIHPIAIWLQLPPALHGDLDTILQLPVRTRNGQTVALGEAVSLRTDTQEQPVHHKDLLPVEYVTADMAGAVDSPLYGMFAIRKALQSLRTPDGATLQEYFIHQPEDVWRNYAIKWGGEWTITYETFRDMGAAYAVGLLLIYLLVVAHFGSYLVPLIIMAPIPLTIIGIMPGHALLGAQFTATSMIGMIALAGIIVRNSILLVDFIRLQQAEEIALEQAIVQSAIIRAQPIVLTALAAMVGAVFILDDPIFNGLAISLISGILVSTLLTLVVIPLLYYVTMRTRTDHFGLHEPAARPATDQREL